MAYKDFTIKARVEDFKAAESALARMNSVYIGLDHQTDYYFKTAQGKLKLRQGTIENLITHYERVVVDHLEKTIVYRYDVNPSQAAIDGLKKSHQQISTICKDRKIYTVEHIKIHLDQLPSGERFIEIEAIDRHNQFTDDELKDNCIELQRALSIPDQALVKTGYMP